MPDEVSFGVENDDDEAVAAAQEDAELTQEDILNQWMAARQRPANVSYYAFTATPKHSTLMLFGRPKDPTQPVSKDNPPLPFHLYTMQQAIDEGFILDVLKHYVTYEAYFRLVQVGDDGPYGRNV